MTSYKNNMGKEVNFYYKPSTHYYLEDKKTGNPWITKLPFSLQCVSQVEMIDQIRKTRFTNQYSYHHGYYDLIKNASFTDLEESIKTIQKNMKTIKNIPILTVVFKL